MSLTTTQVTYSLMARLSAASAVVGALIALRFIGMNQFGYAFFGLVGGAVALLRPLVNGIPALYMLVPLLFIILMITMSILGLANLGVLALVSLNATPKWLTPVWVFRIPFLFAISLLLGLLLLPWFPSENDPPLNSSPRHLIFPLGLLGVALVLRALQRSHRILDDMAKSSPD